MAQDFNSTPLNFRAIVIRFINLEEPAALKNEPDGKRRYGLKGLLDPEEPKHMEDLDAHDAELERLIKHYWPKGRSAAHAHLIEMGQHWVIGPNNRPIQLDYSGLSWGDDNTNATTGEVYNGFAGKYVISANSPEYNQKKKLVAPPGLVSLIKEDPPKRGYKPLPKGDPSLYDGVHANVRTHLYVPPAYPTRIAMYLRGVQPLGFGKAFSGGIDTAREFADFDNDDYGDFVSGATDDSGL